MEWPRRLEAANQQVYYETLLRYGLVEPFQWPTDVPFTPMENFTHCNCPRVYFPVCAYDGVTYVNGCILKCANQTSRRLGPCILYRRRAPWRNRTRYTPLNTSDEDDAVW